MRQRLERIVRRIVDEYSPDRIILFGSHATETPSLESDLDVLVVKSTDERPLDRRARVRALVGDCEGPIDIVVYTPAEMRRLYQLGSPFINDIVETGRVLYMREVTAAWLREADDDRAIAELLYQHGHYRGCCVHAQQASEKRLKAALFERGGRPPKTHDVAELVNRVRSAGIPVRVSADDAAWMTTIYSGRYPTEEGLLPHGEPTQEDAARALRIMTAFQDDLAAALP